MSISSWMDGGTHRGQIGTFDARPYGIGLPVFDIDEPAHVGVQYGRYDRQVQPLAWHSKHIVEALAQNRSAPRSRPRVASSSRPVVRRESPPLAEPSSPAPPAAFTRPKIRR